MRLVGRLSVCLGFVIGIAVAGSAGPSRVTAAPHRSTDHFLRKRFTLPAEAPLLDLAPIDSHGVELPEAIDPDSMEPGSMGDCCGPLRRT